MGRPRGFRRLRKTHLENFLLRGSWDRDQIFVPKSFSQKVFRVYVGRFGGYYGEKNIFGPPGPRDPLQRLGRIGGNRSPIFPSKSVVIGQILAQKTVFGPPPPQLKNSIFGPPRPRDPLQILGRIGGRKSPLVSSKSVVIGPIFGQKTVWPKKLLPQFGLLAAPRGCPGGREPPREGGT